MDDKILLICATGRSGSTTMQRILNTIPNSNICGENVGAINSLLEFYRKIKTTTFKHVTGQTRPISYEKYISENIKPAWYNSYNYQQMVQLIKITIINMFKDTATTNVWGFKEIRYDGGNIGYIKDFKELFPQTKVIIQIRENIAAQSQSSCLKNDKKNSTHFLTKTNDELVNFYKNNKDFCYLNTFEKMFDMNNLKNLFQFIGFKNSFNEAQIKEILENNLKD